tara:strand:- start:841 stop:1158 length:318 start_codon:yes stop_codon:yes gene_type:complete
MDALKEAVLQAEEDSHMRHTPLRQAFNALKNLKKPTQLQGGGGQIVRDTAIKCFRKSMRVSADESSGTNLYKNQPYLKAAAQDARHQDVVIGTGDWYLELGGNAN